MAEVRLQVPLAAVGMQDMGPPTKDQKAISWLKQGSCRAMDAFGDRLQYSNMHSVRITGGRNVFAAR